MNKKELYYELLKNKKTSMDPPYYDYTIDYDISNLPSMLQEEILAMEQADYDKNYIMYDSHLDAFEPMLKNLVNNRLISEADFYVLMGKYGGEI